MSFMLLGILNAQAAGGGNVAMDHLQTTVLSTNASSVSFGSLSNYTDYKHLRVVMSVRGSDSNNFNWHVRLFLNNITTSSYDYLGAQGSGSGLGTVQSFASNNGIQFERSINYSQSDSGYYATTVMDFNDFLDTSKYISVQAMGGSYTTSGSALALTHGHVRSTAALDNILLRPDQGWGSFLAGSRFALYGVK